jgi:hypothetical protein
MQDVAVERQRNRRVTYQLALKGSDGMVLASDQCEWIVSASDQCVTKNLVRKLRIDETGRYAWVYSGSEAGPVFSSHFLAALKNLGASFSEADALGAFKASARAANETYQPFAKGKWPYDATLICGRSKRIMRVKVSLAVDEMLGGCCVSGQEFNLSAFLPSRFYSPRMSVDELTCLASYSIRAAHDCTNSVVDGLDIAVYRDTSGTFEMLDSDYWWNEAPKLDEAIREAIRTHARSLQKNG